MHGSECDHRRTYSSSSSRQFRWAAAQSRCLQPLNRLCSGAILPGVWLGLTTRLPRGFREL